MKKSFVFLLMMSAVLFSASCSKSKSLGEMLKDEKKAINRLRDQNGLVFLDEYPKDGVFKPNEFFKLESGVYMNVVDSGNGKRAQLDRTKVSMRVIMKGLISDTTTFDNFPNGASPAEFTYGNYSFSNPYTTEYYIVSEGIAAPLEYVGEYAIVKLIVPFKQGSDPDYEKGETRYFEKVKYTKFN